MNQRLKPFIIFGPGDFIKDELEVRDWTQADLAKITNLSSKTISLLMKNKARITYHIAQLLGQAFNVSPDYWVNLDLEYYLHSNSKNNEETEVDIKRKIYSCMPISKMINKGWIKDYQTTSELVEQVVVFWEIHHNEFSTFGKIPIPCFKRSKPHISYSNNSLNVWFQMAKNCSKLFHVNNYEPSQLKKIAEDFSAYTFDNKGVKRIINDLNNAGVKFFVLSHLEKTYLDGASFYDGSNPVIVYTKRYDRNDHFWFTLAHEMGHILIHLNNPQKYYLDNLEDIDDEDGKEANEFAEKILKIKEIVQLCRPFKYISEKRMVSCAGRLKVDQAIVVGALQYHNKLSAKNLNRYKKEVSSLIPAEYYIEKDWNRATGNELKRQITA